MAAETLPDTNIVPTTNGLSADTQIMNLLYVSYFDLRSLNAYIADIVSAKPAPNHQVSRNIYSLSEHDPDTQTVINALIDIT